MSRRSKKVLITIILIAISVLIIRLSFKPKPIPYKQVQIKWESFINKTDLEKQKLFAEDIDFLELCI